jgi:hypothetical protein
MIQHLSYQNWLNYLMIEAIMAREIFHKVTSIQIRQRFYFTFFFFFLPFRILDPLDEINIA